MIHIIPVSEPRRLLTITALLSLALLSTSCERKPDFQWTAPGASALKGEPTLTGTPATIPTAAKPPAIDGKLDDTAWASAATLGPLVDPGSGADAPGSPVAGFAKLTWDEKNLYLGFVVKDRDPVSPASRNQDDPHLWERASAVEIMLQPGDLGDNRDYYEIQVDTTGAVFDTHWDDYNTPITGTASDRVYGHPEWSAKLERAAFVQQGAFYAVEIALPWSALVAGRVAIPPKKGDVWRLNLYSFADGQRQALAWSPIRNQGNFHRSLRWGRVRFE